MFPKRDELLSILQEARELLARPGNDFSWSSWRDAEHALDEIDRIIRATETGVLPPVPQIQFLFIPAGPMQEVSLSSGWGDAFIALAERCDTALTGIH